MIKLLIVDDEKGLLEYLKEFFTQRGCLVETAISGDEVLNIIKIVKPDIVLLDIKMPGKDGLEVLKEIKDKDKNIKVIMVTVAADEETRIKAERLGADGFVKKPFSVDYLEGVVSLKIAELTKENKGD